MLPSDQPTEPSPNSAPLHTWGGKGRARVWDEADMGTEGWQRCEGRGLRQRDTGTEGSQRREDEGMAEM